VTAARPSGVDGAEAPAGSEPDGQVHAPAGGDGDTGGPGPAGPTDMDVVPRRARWFVAVLLLALAVPGVIGFELWPMTGWRLFSLSRDESQTAWVIDAVDPDGASRSVDLEELPLGYRHAEWPMAELPGASTARREAVCQALLGAVVGVEPTTVALTISRDRQQLVEGEHGWAVTHDPEVLHTCVVTDAGEAAR
jgi:hypothetical protein